MSPLIRRRYRNGKALQARQRPPRRGTLKGCVHNVIVVKPPDSRFREAVFILRDDYFLNEGVGEAELLRQAREAARDYTYEALPPTRVRVPWALLLFTLAAVLGTLKLLGVI